MHGGRRTPVGSRSSLATTRKPRSTRVGVMAFTAGPRADISTRNAQARAACRGRTAIARRRGPGFLKEVTARFGAREALVLHTKDEVAHWSYQALWGHSARLARALLAAGAGKDSRIGVLMSNRPEFVASLFGVALAGGVAVVLS